LREKFFLFNAGGVKFPLHVRKFEHGWQPQAEVLQEDKLVVIGLPDTAFTQSNAVAGGNHDID
jgi:hypothetical protein